MQIVSGLSEKLRQFSETKKMPIQQFALHIISDIDIISCDVYGFNLNTVIRNTSQFLWKVISLGVV